MRIHRRLRVVSVIAVLTGAAILAGCPADLMGTPELEPPWDLSAELLESGEVLLSWSMNTDQPYDGIIVERRSEDGNTAELADLEPGNMSYTDADQLDPGMYYYRVGQYRHGDEPCYCSETNVEISIEPMALYPPDWLHGTWSDEFDYNIFTFNADNVTATYMSNYMDYAQQNQQYAENGLEDTYYFGEIPDSNTYVIQLMNAGSVAQTQRFAYVDVDTVEYTLNTMSPITLTKEP